jgi:CrcB protein
MPVALAIALGGALGALGRYAVDSLIERHTESVFPWGTFTINMTGCVVVGFLIAALVDRHRAPTWLRAGLVVGVCGGFATFSTFSQETLDLLEGRPSSWPRPPWEPASRSASSRCSPGLDSVVLPERSSGIS